MTHLLLALGDSVSILNHHFQDKKNRAWVRVGGSEHAGLSLIGDSSPPNPHPHHHLEITDSGVFFTEYFSLNSCPICFMMEAK
jgi:hypothetical protein